MDFLLAAERPTAWHRAVCHSAPSTRVSLWVPIIRSWALTRGFALHPGTRNRYKIRYTRTQHRPASRQVNDHGRVSGTHTPRRPAGLGPVAGDSASVPTQQGLWCDEPASSPPSGQGRRDRTQQGPVLIGERWSVVLPAQDCELVAQHDDLEVLRASRAHSQARQRRQQPVQNATHRFPGCKRIMPGQRTRPYFGHPQAPSQSGETEPRQ